MADPEEPLEAHGLRTIVKCNGSRTYEGNLTPELAAKLAQLHDLLAVFDVMDEKPVKLTLKIPEAILQGVVNALDDLPTRRRPQYVRCDGRLFVPNGPTKFWVGADTWHKSEEQLVVRKNDDFPESVTVSCLDDPQIVFPPAERWVRPGRYDVLRGGFGG